MKGGSQYYAQVYTYKWCGCQECVTGGEETHAMAAKVVELAVWGNMPNFENFENKDR